MRLIPRLFLRLFFAVRVPVPDEGQTQVVNHCASGSSKLEQPASATVCAVRLGQAGHADGRHGLEGSGVMVTIAALRPAGLMEEHPAL